MVRARSNPTPLSERRVVKYQNRDHPGTAQAPACWPRPGEVAPGSFGRTRRRLALRQAPKPQQQRPSSAIPAPGPGSFPFPENLQIPFHLTWISLSSLKRDCAVEIALVNRNFSKYRIMRKYRILYLLSSESIVRCRYSGKEWTSFLSNPGSSLRHWPPGTNSTNVRAVFFCSPSAYSQAGAIVPPHNCSNSI